MSVPLDAAVVGVPKCGTTSLHDWLTLHPDVEGSDPKETYFFVDDDHAASATTRFADEGWAGLDRFYGGPRGPRKRLEASAVNLFQDTARIAFAALDPQPLVVVGVRCPVEQIRSAFHFHQNATRIDADLSLEAYLDALMTRDHEVFRRTMPYPHVREFLWRSLDWNRYVDWIDRWQRDFDDDRIHLVTLSDLAQRPAEVVAEIHERMGLDPLDRDEASYVAGNVTSENPVTAPGVVSRVGSRILPNSRVRTELRRWDRTRRAIPVEEPSPRAEALLDELGRFFAASDRALTERHGVDTSSWRSSRTGD